MKEINITSLNANQRLDKFLLKYMNAATKSFIYKMLRKKNIKLNDKKAEGNELLRLGDNLKIYISDESLNNFREEKALNLKAGTIDVVFEDENILACNKPIGLLSQPEDNENRDTLTDRILLYLKNKNEFDISVDSLFTPAICNRLDRNTSGIVICAKNLQASRWLNKAFAERKVLKYYKALVNAKVLEAKELKDFYEKDESKNIAKKVCEGTEIITYYEPFVTGENESLIKIKLITGKSHQIRLQLKEAGLPIIGDYKYGNSKVNKRYKNKYNLKSQLLHAETIIFEESEGFLSYLTKNNIIIKAPINGVFKKIIKDLNFDKEI